MIYQMPSPGPKPSVSDSELIEAIDEQPEPFATAKTVSQVVGLSSERTRQRLDQLAEDGTINRSNTGGVIIYWSD